MALTPTAPPNKTAVWPSANEYMAAIQNPRTCFLDASLREGSPALDRLGMPLVASGNFAYVYKLQLPGSIRAIKCFRQFLGDRERRYGEIDVYLDKVDSRLPALAKFEYDPQGILVGPHRYPVLVMEWIEGPTLDVYLGALLKQPSSSRHAIESLAEDWCRVVKQLEDNNVAHGDLQHGNVIVTSGGFRLVDLDGMYVPTLAGELATEFGHQHFQHPRRAPDLFDSTLDRFPSLVIYVSLMALAEAPELWATYNDDNLLFTAKDFKDPSSSPLFRALDKLGGKVPELARQLRNACATHPSQSPKLSDLVQVKGSKLPAWMTGGGIVTVPTKSREASGPPPTPGSIAPSPSTAQPSRPHSTWMRPTPNAQPSHTTPTTPTPSRSSHDNTWVKSGLWYGIGLLFPGLFFFWIWFPLFGFILESLGVGPKHADRTFWLVFLYVSSCIGLGLFLAKKDSTRKRAVALLTQNPTSTTVSRPTRPTPSVPAPASGGVSVVGSTIRLIYHRPSCEWAVKISRRNRTTFPSVGAAQSRGFRACRVCNP